MSEYLYMNGGEKMWNHFCSYSMFCPASLNNLTKTLPVKKFIKITNRFWTRSKNSFQTIEIKQPHFKRICILKGRREHASTRKKAGCKIVPHDLFFFLHNQSCSIIFKTPTPNQNNAAWLYTSFWIFRLNCPFKYQLRHFQRLTVKQHTDTFPLSTRGVKMATKTDAT